MKNKKIINEMIKRVEDLTKFCQENDFKLLCLVGDEEYLHSGVMNASVEDVGNMFNAFSFHSKEYTLALQIADNIYHSSEELINKVNEQKCS